VYPRLNDSQRLGLPGAPVSMRSGTSVCDRSGCALGLTADLGTAVALLKQAPWVKRTRANAGIYVAWRRRRPRSEACRPLAETLKTAFSMCFFARSSVRCRDARDLLPFAPRHNMTAAAVAVTASPPPIAYVLRQDDGMAKASEVFGHRTELMQRMAKSYGNCRQCASGIPAFRCAWYASPHGWAERAQLSRRTPSPATRPRARASPKPAVDPRDWRRR